MGKLSKRYNSKARSQPTKQADKRTEDDKAVLELGSAEAKDEYKSVAQPNEVVIKSNKQKKPKSKDVKQKRQLSKKQRKKLEKIIEKKKKKAKVV